MYLNNFCINIISSSFFHTVLIFVDFYCIIPIVLNIKYCDWRWTLSSFLKYKVSIVRQLFPATTCVEQILTHIEQCFCTNKAEIKELTRSIGSSLYTRHYRKGTVQYIKPTNNNAQRNSSTRSLFPHFRRYWHITINNFAYQKTMLTTQLSTSTKETMSHYIASTDRRNLTPELVPKMENPH